MHSLSSLVLTVAQQRKVNGLQNRCLRRIFGIAPSYSSRVSNASVLARAGYPIATELLKKRRLQLLGKILRSPEGHPLRVASFIPGTTIPATERFVRRVGRPSKEWVKETILDVISLFGSLQAATQFAASKNMWNDALFDKIGF